MKNKKKHKYTVITLIFFVVMITFSFTACNKTNKEPESLTELEEWNTIADEQSTIQTDQFVVSVYTADDPDYSDDGSEVTSEINNIKIKSSIKKDTNMSKIYIEEIDAFTQKYVNEPKVYTNTKYKEIHNDKEIMLGQIYTEKKIGKEKYAIYNWIKTEFVNEAYVLKTVITVDSTDFSEADSETLEMILGKFGIG